MAETHVIDGQQHTNGDQPTEKPVVRRRFKPDDDDIARAWSRELDGKAAFFYGDWYLYTAGVWQPRPVQRVSVAAREFMRKKRAGGWDIKITRGLVSSVVGLAADDLFVEDSEIDQDSGRYINLRNGLYDLEADRLEPHRPELYLTNQLDFDYDEDADCPTWRRYLNSSLVHPDSGETDHQLIQLLQEAMAYSVTSDTSLKASFWLVGKPDSGKSTLIAFIRALLGDLHATIDLNQLATNRFMLSSIVGKRAVTFTEARVNSVLPDDVFKSIVGGSDEIYADVKNRPGITFTPKAKFWWAMNDMPRISDRSGAVYNRLHAIPFNRSIPPSERISDLGQRLAAERAGVFIWLLVGYRRLMRRGHFIQVEQSQALKESYRLSNDTEQTFINERCTLDTEARTQAENFYYAYRSWCIDNGFNPKNSNQVARDWERLGLVRRSSNGRRYWCGVTVNED